MDDVPPGQYELSINGHYSTAARSDFIEGISALTNIVVPMLADSNQCEPYALGRFAVAATIPIWAGLQSATNTLKVGAVAPAIDTTTHDGKPLHLADYRGKFVLLDFRFLLPGREMDGLQSVNNDFGKDDRFVTISLSQSINEDHVKQTVNAASKHWIVGNFDFAKLADAYGLNDAAFPLLVLVGPDGKIMASQLHGDAIYDTVAQALKK